MSKVMIVSAGWEQVPLVREAVDLGCEVIATHSKSNADGFEYANKIYIVDPRDVSRLCEIAVEEKIDGIISDQCDYAYFATAYIADKMGLPGASLQTALLVTNKEECRKKLASNPKIRQPRFKKCKYLEEARDAVRDIGYPVVVKPTDNRGSIGVSKVANKNGLESAYMLALANSHSREVLVEEYIDGLTEVAVDGYFFKDKGFHVLGIASKKHWKQGMFDEEIINPAEISKKARDRLVDMNSEVVKTVGIDFGFTHVEYMVTKNDETYLMEIHNRGGGVFISNKVLPVLSGINTSRCLIQDCLGKSYDRIELGTRKPFTMIKFLSLPPGKLISADLKDEDKASDSLVAFKIYAEMGKELPHVVNCATRHGLIIVSGNNKNDLYENYAKIYNNLHLQYDK